MSESFLEKILPKLGLLCFEYHPDGYFSCVGESPDWAVELFPCVRNRFPQILPCDISPFLENFIVDAQEFWQLNTDTVLRSGYWTESVQTAQKGRQIQGSEINLEALVLTLDGRPLLLLEVSEVKFFETFNWLQTARKERLNTTVELKESASQMMRASLFDALTGLPNEQAFYIQMAQWFEQLRQESKQAFLLLQLKIDNFASIHASLSQDWGNQCLVQLAKRLKGFCQPEDVIARLGTDRFGLLIQHSSDVSLDAFIPKLMEGLRSPCQLKARTIYSTHSIGGLLIEDAQQGVEVSMAKVSLALSQAQAYGRDQYCIYDDDLRDRQRQQLSLEQTLLTAIDNRVFVPEYRPIFSRSANRFVGFEISLEWPQSPQYSATMLRDLTQFMGLGTQFATYELDACQPILTEYCADQSLASVPLTLRLHSPLNAVFDPRYIQSLTALRAQIGETGQLILQLTDISTISTLEEISRAREQLKLLRLQLCVPLGSLNGISQQREWLQSMAMIAIDPSRQNLDLEAKRMAYPELNRWQAGAPPLFAEQVHRQSHDPIIADLGVNLCCGDFFSEPLSQAAMIALLKSQ